VFQNTYNAHTVNLVVENSIKKHQVVTTSSVKSPRNSKIFLKKSTNISDKLRKKQIDEGKILMFIILSNLSNFI